MPNLKILETFRTKEELLNYFDEIGQNITEKEIENLKKSYEKANKNNATLSLQQLDAVAGGAFLYYVKHVVIGEIQTLVTTLINGVVPSTRTVYRNVLNGGDDLLINPSGNARIFTPLVTEKATLEMRMAQLFGWQPHKATIVIQGDRAQAFYSDPNYLAIYPNPFTKLTGARGDENTPLFIPLFPEVSSYTTDRFVDKTKYLLINACVELQRRADSPREALYLTDRDRQQLSNLNQILPYYYPEMISRTFCLNFISQLYVSL